MIELLLKKPVDLKIKQIRMPICLVIHERNVKEDGCFYENLKFSGNEIDDCLFYGDEFLAYTGKDDIYLELSDPHPYNHYKDIYNKLNSLDANKEQIYKDLQWDCFFDERPVKPIVIFDKEQDLPNCDDEILINGYRFIMIDENKAYALEPLPISLTIEDMFESSFSNFEEFKEKFGKGITPIDKKLVDWLNKEE